MSGTLPRIVLARHGETEWTITGQHTGRSDLPLTERGERNAENQGPLLARYEFDAVFTSPLQRARRTCELAGYGGRAERWDDILEWDYGEYDGRTTDEIKQGRPGWDLFRDGCPGGESVSEVGARADRVVERLRRLDGTVLLFGHGHFFRVLGARWIGLPPSAGRVLVLSTAAVSVLGYEHDRDDPGLLLWNDQHHVEE